MKRKVTAIVLTFCLGVLPHLSYASGVIDETQHEVSIGQGVSFKKIRSFYEWGTQSMNIIDMDMSRSSLKPELIFNQSGFSQRLNLSAMAVQEPDVIAAVNGDFFSMSNPGFSIGPMVKEGKLLSNAHYDINRYASLIVDHDGTPSMAYVYPGTSIENKSRGTSLTVAAVNKPSKHYGNIVVLTKEYMRNSPGASSTYFDITEVVVENDRVREVRFGQPSVPIPENGYVIVAGGANSYVLSGGFTPGEEVYLSAQLTQAYPNVRMAIGGGTMLVKDGAATPITQSVKGKSQRTALAITKDKHLLMVTVDGRKSPYLGMDEQDMQRYMLQLGVKDAMMLDGGGSTEMIFDGKVQNDLIAGERRLVNGLALKPSASVGELAQIDVEIFQEVLFEGEKVELAVRGKDASGNPISLITSSFQIEGEGISGHFDGRYFTPTSSGKGAIKASYGAVTGKKEIEVLAKGTSDKRYVQQESSPSVLTVLPDMRSEPDSLIDDAIKANIQTSIQNSPAVILAGNQDMVFEKGIASPKEAFNGAYKVKKQKDTSIISIDNRNGGIYKVSGQWDYLKGLLSGESRNIVLILQGTRNSADKVDRDVFNKIVQSAAKTKNIYIVYKDKDFSAQMDGYVSYIGIPDYAAMSKDSLSKIRYLEFYEEDGQLLYGFKNIF